MPELKREEIERYLSGVLGMQVHVVDLAVLGRGSSGKDIKGYGYGTPIRVDYRGAGQDPKIAVLHTMTPGPFGHEHMADRAQELIWANQAFNRLPLHVRSLDVSGIQSSGCLISIGCAEEFCLLTEYAEGESYARDLERLRENGVLTELDLARSDALCDYLISIHTVKEQIRGYTSGASEN